MLARLGDINRLFGTMEILRNRLDGLYNDFDWAFTPKLSWTMEDRLPKTNLYEDGDRFEVRAELPGFANIGGVVRIAVAVIRRHIAEASMGACYALRIDGPELSGAVASDQYFRIGGKHTGWRESERIEGG